MKTTTIRLLGLVIFAWTAFEVSAQTNQKASTKGKTVKPKSTTSVNTVTISPVAVTVTLISKCEKNVMIYAGSKNNLHEPKQREVGGLAVNTLYLKTGDVVCIMDSRKKPLSCVNITKATTRLEINFAGTAITVQ